MSAAQITPDVLAKIRADLATATLADWPAELQAMTARAEAAEARAGKLETQLQAARARSAQFKRERDDCEARNAELSKAFLELKRSESIERRRVKSAQKCVKSLQDRVERLEAELQAARAGR